MCQEQITASISVFVRSVYQHSDCAHVSAELCAVVLCFPLLQSLLVSIWCTITLLRAELVRTGNTTPMYVYVYMYVCMEMLFI
jgi:hypothetical protein